MTLKRAWLIAFFSFFASACGAEISPIALTFFGIYGEPVYPMALAVPVADGFGFNVLAEWNATSYTSLGLGFEQISFRGASTVPMMNFEGRLFPMENEKGAFSPYVYGGAGLNLSAGAWEGPVQLKAGIGSRISLAGPLHLDLAVGSHWLQPPNDFQYVDLRYGLSMSFGFKEKPREEKPVAAVSATATPLATPVATPTVYWTPIATPIIEEAKGAPATIELASEPQTITIEAAPVTTLAGVKKYYKLGMKAFMDRNFALSLKLLKKSLSAKEIHGASYYYAETYATLGVIYQFHAHKVKDHDEKALMNYKKALAIDPKTKSAKAYYKKLKAKVDKQKKTKLKKKTRKKPLGRTSPGELLLAATPTIAAN